MRDPVLKSKVGGSVVSQVPGDAYKGTVLQLESEKVRSIHLASFLPAVLGFLPLLCRDGKEPPRGENADRNSFILPQGVTLPQERLEGLKKDEDPSLCDPFPP